MLLVNCDGIVVHYIGIVFVHSLISLLFLMAWAGSLKTQPHK